MTKLFTYYGFANSKDQQHLIVLLYYINNYCSIDEGFQNITIQLQFFQ